MIDNLIKDNGKLLDQLTMLQAQNTDRYDMLLSKQEQILDARLGLNANDPMVNKQEVKPLGRNRNWQADYEKRQRDEHWRKVIEVQERADLEAKVDKK